MSPNQPSGLCSIWLYSTTLGFQEPSASFKFCAMSPVYRNNFTSSPLPNTECMTSKLQLIRGEQNFQRSAIGSFVDGSYVQSFLKVSVTLSGTTLGNIKPIIIHEDLTLVSTHLLNFSEKKLCSFQKFCLLQLCYF